MAAEFAQYLPTRRYSGYIFDCDGTLADSMPLHHQAWTHALNESGAPFDFPYEQMCSWGGKSLQGTVADLNTQHGTRLDASRIRSSLARFIQQHLPSVQPRAHIVELARELATQAPVAVASGGHRQDVHITLNAIGVRDLFEVIITQDDVTHSKPAPDIFLIAAERLGVKPTECLVYEDSPTGIAAAKAAGMDVIRVDA